MRKHIIYLLIACLLFVGCAADPAQTTAPEPTLCDHLWQETDCVTRSVCLKCGLEGACGGHWFSPAGCAYPGECAVCDAQIPALGHDLVEADCLSPARCSRCDYTEGLPLGHEGEESCIRCGISLLPRFDIILEPGTIKRDTGATFAFMGEPDTLYSITVYVKSGASKAKGLDAKMSDETGYVSWSWWVGENSTPGTYKIVIVSENMQQIVEYTITE